MNNWQLYGAFGFGLLIGWYVYFVNRYRKGDVQLGDLVTLLGAIGGSAVLTLFEKKTDLFGAYGIGLAAGFFGYFVVLIILVSISFKTTGSFNAEWFLDGRRKNPPDGWGYAPDARQPVAQMALPPPSTTTTNHFYGQNPGEAAALAMGVSPQPFAAPNLDAQRIQGVCRAVWGLSGPQGPFKDACNFFVIEVAHRLGIIISGRADQIVGSLGMAPWQPLANGVAARNAAAQGKFVLVGLKSSDFVPPQTQGHVAVVTAGEMNPAGWAPAGYWGSTSPNIADVGGSGLPISQCFTANIKDKLVYACRDI